MSKRSEDKLNVWNSIRTQSALATVLFLVFILTAFYIGGRIVVMHLVREAEEQQVLHATPPTPTPTSNSNSPSTSASASDASLTDTALEYYSGGFWNFEGKVPQNLVGLTRFAMVRLGLFIGVGGILMVLLIFFVQSRLFLDPLSRMTKKVAEIGRTNDAKNCPRLEWKGKDEFAQLAVSVNRMLEMISQRTVAVAEAEARQRDLISSLPDELLVFGSDGCFVSVLKAAEDNGPLPGLYPGEMLAEGVYGRESVLRFREAITATIGTGRVSKLKLQVRRPFDDNAGGETRHFDVRIVRIDEYFALAMVADTTEEMNERNRLRLAEQRIADAEKRESLTLLAASIAHDMNNVLSVVVNAAESDRADPSGDSAAVLNTIREAVRRGAGMMRELQTYAGENSVSLVRTTPHRIVDDIRLLVEPLFPKSILVSYDKAADAPDVDADPDQFWKVIFNIAKNAGEAIGKNRPGRVIIGCARMLMTAEDAHDFVSEAPLPPGPGTVFTIRDDGPGIAADILPRVFDPYVSSRALGRGLGLATVRTIVEAHGGGLRVTSRLGVGTLFEIFLPESRLPKPDAAAANDAPVAPGDRKDVLIVDDETLILRTSAILLKGIGMVPHTAKDNSGAMAIVRRHAKALRAIILDADIGGVDTVRLLASIRTSAPGVPVIVSTGTPEDQVAKLFASCPYDAFLSKPYTLDELKTALAHV